MMNHEKFLLTEKYRPRRVADTILPKRTKEMFQGFVDKGEIPNLILTGPAGTGKTTSARAMIDEIGSEHIMINGSDEGRMIDTFRTIVTDFASSVSFLEEAKRKYVIIDEGDYTNAESVQPLLRNAYEKFANNCGFIITCNLPNRIIKPLHSRSIVVDFSIPVEERPALAAQFYKRLCYILEQEKIEYDKKAVTELVTKYFPDLRRVLNEIQRYSVNGKIDAGILSNSRNDTLKSLVEYMRKKDFKNMRKWVAENPDIDASIIFRDFYDNAIKYVAADSVPSLVVTTGEYQYKHAFVADPEINISAFLTEIMYDCKWS